MTDGADKSGGKGTAPSRPKAVREPPRKTAPSRPKAVREPPGKTAPSRPTQEAVREPPGKTAPSRPMQEAVREPPGKTAPGRPTQEAVREPPGHSPAERIAKRMARAGLCSRREAEAWIRAGRVAVDGQVLDSPAFTVTAASRIEVDGRPLPAAQATRLWRYHKPRGLLTTNRDVRGRPIIFDHLPADLPRVVTVGRLDMNSEGLLLLTNDGDLARRLELPATGWVRRYRVRVRGTVEAGRLEALARGIEIEGVRYGPIRASLDRQLAANAWLSMSLNEGKNREVRRVCEHLGWPVLRLIRIAYGPFQLGNLPPGAVSEAPASVLRDQLGGGGKRARTPKKKPSAPPARTPTPTLPHQGGGGKKVSFTKEIPSPHTKKPSPLVGEGWEGGTPTRRAAAKPRRKPGKPDAHHRRKP